MYGNGVVIGMENIRHIRRPIPLVPHQALIACFVAVAGTTMRSAVEYRIAAATIPATETTATASV